MNKPVIVCVDDEADILNTLKMQLKNEFKDNYFYEYCCLYKPWKREDLIETIKSGLAKL